MKKVKSRFRNPVLFFIPLDKEEMDATYEQLHVRSNVLAHQTTALSRQ